MANEPSVTVAVDHLFATVSSTPAVQGLQWRLEEGGVLLCAGASPGAQPFLVALLRQLYPQRAIVAVVEGVKSQENFQQDLETWFKLLERGESSPPAPVAEPKSPAGWPAPLFYPAWEILPHEEKLPHADVISERLETLLTLLPDPANSSDRPPATIVTNVIALLQRTYAPETLRQRMRRLRGGDTVDPMALAEWLQAQGYEPEAKVENKGQISLRGGILDIFPPTSPWPVRLEFFGDELDSLRYFDPITQISRESIAEILLPPAGELGLLKRALHSETASLETLLDYLPADTFFVLCEPDRLEERAGEYAASIPAGDPFFAGWEEVLAQAEEKRLTQLCISEQSEADQIANRKSQIVNPLAFSSLESFRPILERAPEPQVAEAQRREFFEQLHRWLRQGYGVHVFCNNAGERQRFAEIWDEYGLGRMPNAQCPMQERSKARPFAPPCIWGP